MGKSLFIAEKPSVAMEFAKALGVSSSVKKDGYIEDDKNIVTWCVGHLIEMCYPETYDADLKKWTMDALPFIPKTFKYEVISSVEKQYDVVASLLNRNDVTSIYYSGDSAREGEYIQRLVRQMAGHNPNAKEYRVWIDSQTKEEILNGIRNAHELSYYDSLSDSAYARAKEDYLVGINFSRALSIKYGNKINEASGSTKYKAIAVGRVMTCVLGMIVERERQIRNAEIIPFYGISANLPDELSADWKIVKGSRFDGSPDAYKTTGLLKKPPVEDLIKELNAGHIVKIAERKKATESKAAPLLYNLAELQSDCSSKFKISPDETLTIAQSLYEKKLTTYPRTDARVLTTAISKVYDKNISGLTKIPEVQSFAEEILSKNWYDNLRKKTTKYIDDSKVSDHYAIIPTGSAEGLQNLSALSGLEKAVYIEIAKRFLSIFYPQAEYDKLNVQYTACGETFTASYTALNKEGWLAVAGHKDDSQQRQMMEQVMALPETVSAEFSIKEGKSQPPKRYTTGSMILAMENAGNLIEDETLREQIKGSGIGTSATRADTLKKLETNEYIKVNKKTQVIQPDKMGELIYEVVKAAVPDMLKPKYTASWEQGLQMIVDRKITEDVYDAKINNYVKAIVAQLKDNDYSDTIVNAISSLKKVYPDIGTVKKTESELVCPICGKPLRIGKNNLFCSGYKDGCHFSAWTSSYQKKLSDTTMKKFISTMKKQSDGSYKSEPSSLIKGFKKKDGGTFDAKLYLVFTADGKSKYEFAR